MDRPLFTPGGSLFAADFVAIGPDAAHLPLWPSRLSSGRLFFWLLISQNNEKLFNMRRETTGGAVRYSAIA
jgi:hypothetical protein